MRFFSLVIFVSLWISCKNDGSLGLSGNTIDIDEISGEQVDPATLKTPKACDMITDEKLKEILNIQSAITLKDSSDPENLNSQACFFKWDDPNTSNAGILIQITTNPVYEEYPGYISGFVQNKIKEGENIMGQDTPIKYKSFKIGSKEGAYSFDQGRFYWNGGGNYLFMLAFNVSTLSEQKMLNTAQKIISEIHTNFASNI